MKNQTKVLLGIAGAALAGAVIGMLVAPEKGCDTRKKIKETAGDWADKLKKFAGKAETTAKNLANDAVDSADEMLADVQNKAGRARSAIS